MKSPTVFASLGLDKSMAAMIRAAVQARLTAMRTGTKLVLWQDGKVVHVSPDEVPPLVPEQELKRP